MKRNTILFAIVLSLSLLVVNSNAQSTIRMNEIYSTGVPGDLDWIEIYNSSASAVDISGYKIYDSGGQAGTKAKKLFPNGTIVTPKGYTVIVVDTATFVGDLSGFGLSSGGETVWLENAAGVLIDTVVFPALGKDTSYSRIPDGSNIFAKNTPHTKGVSNVRIKMNEIYSTGVPGALDWIEIYNSSTAAIDISGYKIYDSGGQAGTKAKKLFPNGTIVNAKGYTVIIVDTATFVGDLSGFGISSGGETVWLENAAGMLIDTVAIPALGKDTSYARVPDGSNVLVKKTPVTRGLTNGSGTSVQYEKMIASEFVLNQNYPNPFNPSTTVTYQIPMSSFVSLKIFDIVGREVATLVNQQQEIGKYHATFNASALSSGVYLYRLNAGYYSQMKKMVLVK